MILTKKQMEGLKIAVARYKSHKPYTCIAGYAGTGKSTLIKFIVAALDLEPSEVVYVAYTGKAAQVLKQKGCESAITAHKLLYFAEPLPNGKYRFKKKPTLDESPKLIVVDEISMLPKPMWDLLLTHKIPVIACGDPAQLPPISKNDDNGVLDKPHIFLDEIMRQAQDSEIIRLSMHIREGKPISSFNFTNQEVQCFSKSQLTTGMYLWADQILCATNNTRFSINDTYRKIMGRGEEPEIGDKIIGLKNQWEHYSWDPYGNIAPLTNGTIGTISDFRKEELRPSFRVPKSVPYLYTNMTTEDGYDFINTPVDYLSLTTGQKAFTGEEEYKIMTDKRRMLDAPFEFSYAYAITVWKAQGSEWKKVLLFEENFPFDKEEHKKYLYTGITRASEKLVLITK